MGKVLTGMSRERWVIAVKSRRLWPREEAEKQVGDLAEECAALKRKLEGRYSVYKETYRCCR